MGVLPPYELASIVDEFAFRLYSVLAELHPDSIIVFSPLSILMGAALAYMAANGETLRQLQFGLLGKRSVTKLDLDQSIYGIMKEVNKNSFMRMENKVYLQVNETIGPKYQLCLVDNFGSEIENIDFATPTRNINNWVEEQTNGAIKNFLKFDALHSTTRVILLNTLRFKGNWNFLPLRTENNFCSVNNNGTNELINLEQYYLEGHWRGGNILGTDTLLMPFRDAKVSRLVNVPSSVKDLRTFDTILKSSSLNSIWKAMEQTTTGWFLSRTNQSVVELGLVEAFKKMGMRNLFGANADFASMLTSSVPLRVSRFIHKTYMNVDDKGAEAIAVSALQLHSKCSKKHVAVNEKLCDKSYFFTYVYEGDNNVLIPIFMGRGI